MYAVFAGGKTSVNTYSNRIDVWDYFNGNWRTNSLSVARAYMVTTAVGSSKAVFAGGENGNGAVAVIDTWSSSGLSSLNLTVARSRMSAGYMNNVLMFAGGCYYQPNRTIATDIVEAYNTTRHFGIEEFCLLVVPTIRGTTIPLICSWILTSAFLLQPQDWLQLEPQAQQGRLVQLVVLAH